MSEGCDIAAITFERRVEEARLRSPLLGFGLEVQPIEFRQDPLTHRWCRINVKRTQRKKQVVMGAQTRRVIKESESDCLFCPENLEGGTPRFPADVVQEGRVRVGSAYLFPNLFPFGGHHAVAVLSKEHYLELNRFSSGLLRDGLRACVEYVKRVRERSPDVRYCSVNWNHMPPAGASVIHPHLQVLAGEEPTNELKQLIDCSVKYHERIGKNYWGELVRTEEELGERFIGVTGSVAWLASYAPLGNNEVLGVFADVSAVSKMDESHIQDLSHGLSRILRGYHALGVRSFNMALLSGRLDQDLRHYSLHLRMISRPTPTPFQTSDAAFMERLHHEPIIETMPERVARRLRKHLQTRPYHT